MKKVMIALLSLAVLFAFTACPDGSDSSSQTLEDQAVVKIEVTEGPDTYFVGDTFSAEAYTVVATRANGETFEVTDLNDLDFSEVEIPSSATSATATSASLGSVKYVGNSLMTVKEPTAEIYATVYNVDAINVVAKSSQTKYYDGSSTADLADDYVVTAYALKNPTTDKADAALYSREIPSDQVVVTATNTADDAFNKEGKSELTFSANGVTTPITGGTNKASVIVYADYLESISLSTEGATKAAVDGVTIGTASDYIVITYNMVSGKTGDTTATGATAATAKWPAEISSTSKFVAGTSYTITVTAKVGFEQTEKEYTIPVKAVENTIVSFDVAKGASTTINPKTELKGTDFTVTAHWLAEDGTKPEGVTPAVLQENLLLNGAASYTVPEDYPAGTELPVKFTLKNYPNATCDDVISTETV